MTEKVLGFRKKDAILEPAPHSHPLESEKEMDYSRWSVLENKLVPVITIEEHEVILNKEIKKWTDIVETIANNQIKARMKEIKAKQAGKQ